MPLCPNCGHAMTSGEECRLFEATGRCFACYPGGPSALLDMLMGVDGPYDRPLKTEKED